MKKEIYNSLLEKTEILSKLINGGKGSGNFGHGGRPGKVGGSSQSGGFSKGQSVEEEKSSKDGKKDIIDKYSAKWKEKGLDKPASSISELEKQIKDAKELYKDFSKEYNPADAAELGASLRVEKTIKEMEDTLDRLKKDEADYLKKASSKAEKELKDSKAKVDELEKSLKQLDKEGVPFTAPRYWSTYDDYKKAKADYLKKAAEYQKSGEAKKEIDRVAKKDGGRAESDKTKLALQISGVNTRIRGLSDRISALEAGIKDDMAKGYTDSLKRDKAVLKDLKRQLTEAKKDKTEYEKARKKITEK